MNLRDYNGWPHVLAFLLMGLQARAIILRFDAERIWQALGFAAVVVAVVMALFLWMASW